MQMSDVTTVDAHIHTQLNWVFDHVGKPQLSVMPDLQQRLDELLPDAKSMKMLLRCHRGRSAGGPAADAGI